MTTENPQAFRREGWNGGSGGGSGREHYDIYYFFSVKPNVKDIFIDKKKLIFRNRLKKLNVDKTFEDTIENELDFHDYGTVKIEVQ